MEQVSPRRHPFSSFGSFSRLFSTYTQESEPLATFFAGDFRNPRQRGQIARQVADIFPHRAELTTVLREQNSRFSAGQATLDNIDRLEQPDAVAVVTGQQLGFFGGPLYTLLKTITTIQLAGRIEQDTGRPVIPVFWLEGEDHDFEEVASTRVFSGQSISEISYGTDIESDRGRPVGRIILDERIEGAIRNLETVLPPTDFRSEIIEMLESSYQKGVSFMDGFARLMCRLFAGHGLVFISGDDARLKSLAAPLFKKEILDYSRSQELLRETSQKLDEKYHVQVVSTPPNLFMITDMHRRALSVNNDRYELKGSDISFTSEELLARLESSPESFSPNVVLRPLYQDTILPTAAYVGGPGEISYFAQFRSLYEWAGIPMPIIYPRASVSLVESKIAKVLDSFSASIPAFETPLEDLFHEMVLDAMEVDPGDLFDRAASHLDAAIDEVQPVIAKIDPSLNSSAGSTQASLMKEWGRLRDRVVKAEKRRHEQMKSQLSKAGLNLFPNGSPQERVISPLYFLNKYGPGLVTELLDTVDLDTSMHQQIRL
jgi:bacillithiol synthase